MINLSDEFGMHLIDKLYQFYGSIGANQIAGKLRFYYFKYENKLIKEVC